MRLMSRSLFAALAGGVLLAACSEQANWRTDSIDGLMPKLEFRMTDDSGRTVDAQRYRGRTVLLFFGYTSCPDVCPTTLANLAAALARTKERGAGSTVLFVSVDPQRDTLERLHAYVHAFGPAFVGLRGTPEQIAALAKRYRVTYSLGKPDAQGNYEVTHSTAVFVFDRTGRSRLLMLPRDSVDAIAADLERLAAESGA